MRFSELQLIRYGQFDGCRLSFPQTPADLHVVYGPNEAGKTTAMAAIADLLFGFLHGAAYDFQFDKQLLRVGGVIDDAGASVTYRRKRGNVRTLLDVAEQPVDEAALTALLCGQARDNFLRAFSLDHTRLRDGGRAILEAKDDIGQAIFAAGSGLVWVTRLVTAMEAEAKAIWTDRANATRTFYAAQRAYDEARARLRESQVKAGRWAELKKSLDGHESELETLRRQREALQGSLQTTERRRRSLAPIARRAHLLAELGNLGALPTLPADAAAILEGATRQIAENDAAAHLAQEQAGAAREQLADLRFDTTILGHRADITGLRAQQGAVDKAIRDTPNLRGRAAAGAEHLRRLLREVGWPDADARTVQARLPGRPQVSELRDLLEEHRSLETIRSAADEEMQDRQKAGSGLDGQIETLLAARVDAGFGPVLHSVRSQGDLEQTSRAARARQEKAKRALDDAIAGLTPWLGDEAALAALALPSEIETYALAETLAAAEEDLADATTALKGLREERDHRELRRSQLVRDQHGVSLDMLQVARGARDSGWARISSHLTGERPIDALAAAQDGFSRDLKAADDLADRRFDAARTSAALVGLDQDLERLDLSIVQAEARIAAHDVALASARTAWAASAAIVSATLSPEALKAWRADRTRTLELAAAEHAEMAEALRLEQAAQSARAALAAALPAEMTATLPGAPLAALLQAGAELEARAQQFRDEHQTLEAQRKAADEALQRAEARRADADRRLDMWRGRWAMAIAGAGLDAQGSLSLQRARLDLVDEIRGVADGIVGFEQRVHDIGVDVAGFGAAVQSLATDVGLANLTGEPSAVLTSLEERLEAVATLVERADGLRDRLSDAETRQAKAQAAGALARSALAPLLAAAKVGEPDELRGVLQRLQSAADLTGQVEELAGAIIDLGDGLGLETLVAEAADADAADLSSQCERLQDQLRTLSDEIERIAELRQAAYLQFRDVDDRPDAAIAAADIAQARAEMESQAEAYVRKRAEAALLRWTVERYRREKQAPLLARASAIFSELTLGHYASLGVDVEDGGPRLSGIRPDGATVVPVASMSEGTIDQLFLALRLAALEENIAAGVKLPFLADDLFINYDDERSAAGFRVLAKLAEQTQVLFFTHHEHLAELARQVLTPGRFSTCRLGELSMEAA
jgi:uncharacterized protein YhaN